MRFDVEEAINGFTVKVNEGADLHVARTAEEVAEIVTKTLVGPEPVKTAKARKPRGKNKKKAAAAAANADTLSGLNT